MTNLSPSSSEEGLGWCCNGANYRDASDAGASPPPPHPSSEEEGLLLGPLISLNAAPRHAD
jgi:hypothetical protein